MSKIGNKNILVPKEVNIAINAGQIDIKGPMGIKKISVDDKIFKIQMLEKNLLSIKPREINQEIKKYWGMQRSLLNNAVIGVSKGYEKILEVNGVGYRASINGKNLNLKLGYSHAIDFEIPDDVKITVEKQTTIKINGFDKEKVGMIASRIKSLRPTEPYKGKGIKEKNEYILRKEGKKK